MYFFLPAPPYSHGTSAIASHSLSTLADPGGANLARPYPSPHKKQAWREATCPPPPKKKKLWADQGSFSSSERYIRTFCINKMKKKCVRLQRTVPIGQYVYPSLLCITYGQFQRDWSMDSKFIPKLTPSSPSKQPVMWTRHQGCA